MVTNFKTAPANLVETDYLDRDGIRHQVILPAGAHDPAEGIPVSLDVDSLFRHCSIEFRHNLNEELWARGLIKPADFLKAGAPELIRAAMQSAVKKDVLDIISLAKEHKA